MSNCWVVNASPLILLGKADCASLLLKLAAKIIIPEGVAEEVRIRPDGLVLLDELVASPHANVEHTPSISKDVELWDLGRGESEVLTKARSIVGCRAVIDDLAARRCA